MPHLDPFHVNRAVLSCFLDPKAGWHVFDAIADGGIEGGCRLADLGEARPNRVARAVAYLRGNASAIAVEGPSLGTMESESQRLYGVRMDSFPCAWSREGASAMARVRSRLHSGREVPRMTRAGSETPRRRARRERCELDWLGSRGLSASAMVECAPRGYEPPHRASVASLSAEVRYAAGVDGGMVAVG